jgi:hypothetical protein
VDIPSFDDPRKGNFATSELLPLDGCLSFSNLLKACLFHILNLDLLPPPQR